jgi:hypothetical protein
MEPSAAAAAAAHRRVKRAMGLLRAAAASLAADARDVDLVAELELRQGDPVEPLLELLALARHRHGDVDVVILTRPGGRRHPGAGWQKDVAPPSAEDRPPGLPPPTIPGQEHIARPRSN